MGVSGRCPRGTQGRAHHGGRSRPRDCSRRSQAPVRAVLPGPRSRVASDSGQRPRPPSRPPRRRRARRNGERPERTGEGQPVHHRAADSARSPAACPAPEIHAQYNLARKPRESAGAAGTEGASPGLQLELNDRLPSEGYTVEHAGDGEQGLARAMGEPPDLIVLDVMLPKRDGLDVAKTLRHQGVQTPSLMLAAKGQVVDRVVGLKMGADDYLTKPFEMIELLARLEALLRRAPPAAGVSLERYGFGDARRRAEGRSHKGRRADGALREGVSPAAVLHRASGRHALARGTSAAGGYRCRPRARSMCTSRLRQSFEPNSRILQSSSLDNSGYSKYASPVERRQAHRLRRDWRRCSVRSAACFVRNSRRRLKIAAVATVEASPASHALAILGRPVVRTRFLGMLKSSRTKREIESQGQSRRRGTAGTVTELFRRGPPGTG